MNQEEISLIIFVSIITINKLEMKSITEINKIHKNFLNVEIFNICLNSKFELESFCFELIFVLLHFLYIKYKEKDKDKPNE